MLEVTCNFIDCCSADYLSDHHNRDNECLIHCIPYNDRSQVLEDLLLSSEYCYIPNNISNEQIKKAIDSMIDSLTDEQICPDYYSAWIDSDDDLDTFNDFYLYAYLSW